MWPECLRPNRHGLEVIQMRGTPIFVNAWGAAMFAILAAELAVRAGDVCGIWTNGVRAIAWALALLAACGIEYAGSWLGRTLCGLTGSSRIVCDPTGIRDVPAPAGDLTRVLFASISGPLLCLLAAAGLKFSAVFWGCAAFQWVASMLAGALLLAGAIQLLPVVPLAGSVILGSVLQQRHGFSPERAGKTCAWTSMVTAMTVALAGILAGWLSLLMLGVFLWMDGLDRHQNVLCLITRRTTS